jgi:hypothetical protein
LDFEGGKLIIFVRIGTNIKCRTSFNRPEEWGNWYSAKDLDFEKVMDIRMNIIR